jgi:hypothetical protein
VMTWTIPVKALAGFIAFSIGFLAAINW